MFVLKPNSKYWFKYNKMSGYVYVFHDNFLTINVRIVK